MLKTVFVVAFVLVALPASAKDLSVTLNDQEQQNWQALGPVFEQCVSAALFRGDASVCRGVAQFLDQFKAKVGAAQQAAPKEEPPKPAGEKK